MIKNRFETPEGVKPEHYTFGDTVVAAERLRLLARVFEPGSARLLGGLELAPGGLALDLGCGSGHTTRLVAESTACARVIGLDQSKRLLEAATLEHSSPRLSFVLCDVTALPLPAPAADLLYARFLLTHLRDPATVVRGWAAAALPGARLVLEETAFLTAEHEIFAHYYALVERMQAHYGQRMYIGRELETFGASPEWSVERADTLVSPLACASMARLHLLNLETWSSDPFAKAHYPARELSAIGEGLRRIATGEDETSPVSCGMGQLVLRRA